ncbi:HTH_Tnp_Tc3_2 domain-containing protein [Trichonephila clavipes]|nr:HTH_Tnp_Tc3_2 domain-containing protein [Trichonephila clavipes]
MLFVRDALRCFPTDSPSPSTPLSCDRDGFSNYTWSFRLAGVESSCWGAQPSVSGLVDAPCCWPGGSFRNCRLQWTREGTHAWKTGSGATRKTARRDDRRIMRKALVDPTVTRSTIRADLGVAIVPQTISRHLAEANLKSKRPFRALPLTSATASTVVQSQINVECHRLAKGCV